jgi:D-alanyl-D-alanine carboxypeptidase/D-alanyl-D-alanine-endopeptidase (penicillin-binding protein 4)
MTRSENMLAANLSFYVADENGNVIYEYQGNKGLSTASTQKIFTAIAALDKLGPSLLLRRRHLIADSYRAVHCKVTFILLLMGIPHWEAGVMKVISRRILKQSYWQLYKIKG